MKSASLERRMWPGVPRVEAIHVQPATTEAAREGRQALHILGSVTTCSIAILVKKEGVAQMPMYYTNRALRGTEVMYSRMEMLAFSLVVVARRLWPYLQAHPIKVLTENPQRNILQKPDSSGKLVSWSIKLSEFDIDYLPKDVRKGQALADFITEFTYVPQEVVTTPVEKPWQVFVNDSSLREREEWSL